MFLDVDYRLHCPPQHYEIVVDKEKIDSYFTRKRNIYECEDGETIFIIARHGENESNLAGTYDGRTLNLPLTEKGHLQGKTTGQKLSRKITHIDHIITTSMVRTHQTAMRVLEAFPQSQPEFTVDNGFLERYVGKYEGGPLKALEPVNQKDKKVSSSQELSFEEKMQFIPEEGVESFASIWQRASESLQKSGSVFKNKVVLIVTHSGTMRSLYWYLTQKLGLFVPYENFKPDNGAYMIVSMKNNEMTLLETDDIHYVSLH